jgi:hypothetical protein
MEPLNARASEIAVLAIPLAALRSSEEAIEAEGAEQPIAELPAPTVCGEGNGDSSRARAIRKIAAEHVGPLDDANCDPKSYRHSA